MEQVRTLSLVERLEQVAAIWVEAHEATLARLGRAVVNDPGFFTGLAEKPQGTTTVTLGKFAVFFADPANWPAAIAEGDEGAPCGPNASPLEGRIPEAALQFCHAVGVTAPVAALSAGKGDHLSQGAAA